VIVSYSYVVDVQEWVKGTQSAVALTKLPP